VDSARPVGIFDSGMGGLTVFKEISKVLPEESLIYFGDTAHLPYGSKSPEAVVKYSLAIAGFLKSMNIKLLVVACNTASVYALPELQNFMNIPVVGVVESGVNAALKTRKKSVCIIGTYGTIKSRAYEDSMREKAPDVKIFSRACPLFVPLVEEGWTGHYITEKIAGEYLAQYKDSIDSIILACTHYPLLKKVISKTLGDKISIIDSAEEVAKAVKKEINRQGMSAPENNEKTFKFFVSDAPELFKERGPLFLGQEIEKVELVEVD